MVWTDSTIHSFVVSKLSVQNYGDIDRDNANDFMPHVMEASLNRGGTIGDSIGDQNTLSKTVKHAVLDPY